MSETNMTLRVTKRLDFAEGPPMIDRFSTTWPGWSAKDAYRYRLRRLREAKADIIAVDGTTIIVRYQRAAWTETETLTFTDSAEVTDPPGQT